MSEDEFNNNIRCIEMSRIQERFETRERLITT